MLTVQKDDLEMMFQFMQSYREFPVAPDIQQNINE
jgi:hypothetical protein